MTTDTTTFRTLDIPLGAGRMLRLAVYRDGPVAELLIACGEPSHDPWERIEAEGVCLPAAVLPGLAAAIEAEASHMNPLSPTALPDARGAR